MTNIDTKLASGDHLDQLFHYSPAMRKVLDQVSRAAATRASVLICGEPGTGRRMVARSIHAHAPNGAFVTVDCAAEDPEAVERELFGQVTRPIGASERRSHERVTRDSHLVAASGGTLFLFNLFDMSARLQARLVRVLRDREAVVAGVGERVGIDVRPIAVIEPGFENVIKEGGLREDLMRRLSAVRIDVPPLRSRREDIPALASSFVGEICAERRVPAKTLSRPALSLIAALPWRGNATELRGLLRNIVAQSTKAVIDIEDVLGHVRLDGGSVVFANGGTLRQARTQFEREYIAAVLEQHRGRISDAARTLGIQRTNLYRKIRSLRVPRRRA